MAAAMERERKHAEDMARIEAEGERIAEEEKIKWQQKQELNARIVQEQKERDKQELEEYRKHMKEKEELMRAIVTQRGYFMDKYGDIVILSRTCKDKRALNIFFATNGAKIRELYQQVEGISEKTKVIIKENVNKRFFTRSADYRVVIH